MEKDNLVIGEIYCSDISKNDNYVFMFEGFYNTEWISASYLYNSKYFTANRKTFAHVNNVSSITFASDEQKKLLKDCILRGDHVKTFNENYPIC